MQDLFNLTLGVVLLYVFYRLLSQVILPKWSEHRLKKYKKELLEKNPQIDAKKLEAKLKEDEEKSPIIDKRLIK